MFTVNAYNGETVMCSAEATDVFEAMTACLQLAKILFKPATVAQLAFAEVR